MGKLLSIVIPAYNEEENILAISGRVLSVVDAAGIQSEVIFVSDGSRDGTFERIRQAAKGDSRIRGIEFTRNFGKEAAMLAGLNAGRGDCFAVLDCDLQHPPEIIVEMYRLWEQGYEIVEGIKNRRGNESALRKRCADAFYGILSKLTGFDMANSSDFKLIDRKVVDVLTRMPERKTFFRALTFWTGFKSCQIGYDVAERNAGVTKWSLRSLIKYALTNIISFSAGPLNIISGVGIASLVLSLILGVQTLIRWICRDAVEGFTTVILLLLILGGCILISLGLIGQYIAAIYDEIKQRPRYIIGKDTRSETPDKQG